MKYEFIEKNLDEYELHYINKEGKEVVKPFKRTVELAHKLASADKDARLELFSYLTSMGKTKDDFIIKKEVDGKIIYDETNYREFESSFLQNKSLEIAIKIYEELFKMDFTDLIIDLGLNENDAEAFGNFNIELHNIIANGKVKTPSSKEKDNK